MHRFAEKAEYPKSPEATAGEAPGIVQKVLRASGRSPEPGVHAFFEPRLGPDFSTIRIHADRHAAQSAQAVGATAYTVDHDIVFAKGRFAPHAPEGQLPLAHELAPLCNSVAASMAADR